jgi:hypothetical protein
MQESDFRRLVVTPPYWCPGDPCAWRVNGSGIGNFALDGKVGKFNLAWWFLNLPTPPTELKGFQHAGVTWTIFQSATRTMHGRTVEELASFNDQQRFHELVRQFKYAPVTFSGVWPMVQARLNQKVKS